MRNRVKVAVTTILICTAFWLAWHIHTWAAWPRLGEIDPTLRILNEPQRLLHIAAEYTAPKGVRSHPYPGSPTALTRQEALRALLNLQRNRFGMDLKPDRSGNYIEVIVVEKLPAQRKGQVCIRATTSQYPDVEFGTGQDTHHYFSEEVLTFDDDGRLLKRIPVPRYHPHKLPGE